MESPPPLNLRVFLIDLRAKMRKNNLLHGCRYKPHSVSALCRQLVEATPRDLSTRDTVTA